MRQTLVTAIITFWPAVGYSDVMLFANDYTGFAAAAGPLAVIDFESRPDGLPWNGNEIINDNFNYDAHGVHFSAPLGDLRIGGNEITGFDLRVTVPSGQRTWIIADLITPAYAVGAHFPGTMTLCAYDLDGNTLGCVSFSAGGAGFFVGIVSTTAIGRAVFDRGSSIASIQDFQFSPIPEPASAALLAAGVGWLLRVRQPSRRTAARRE